MHVDNYHTERFAVTNGLCQGCTMAPVLFNLYFFLVLESGTMRWPSHVLMASSVFNCNLFSHPRTKHRSASVTDLELADDAVLVTPSRCFSQLVLETFNAVASLFRLTTSFIKTKVMGCGVYLSEAECQPLVVSGQTVDHVKAFVYLDTLLSQDARIFAF